MPDSEPTFVIRIQTCEFRKLNQIELIRKLKLMHDLNLINHYTVVEDTDKEYPPPAPAITEK